MPGDVGRLDHASGTGGPWGATARCTHTSLFVLAAAFLCTYDLAESCNLCAFLLAVLRPVVTRLWVPCPMLALGYRGTGRPSNPCFSSHVPGNDTRVAPARESLAQAPCF